MSRQWLLQFKKTVVLMQNSNMTAHLMLGTLMYAQCVQTELCDNVRSMDIGGIFNEGKETRPVFTPFCLVFGTL